jgi:3-oxoacyl-[acyl-carrier-protein] synthase-3
MKNRPKARIIGMGAYLPDQVLSNKDLEKMVETSDEWILSRTGIQERRIAAREECTSDMGAAASKKALANAGISAKHLDLILVATMTPDYIAPSTAPLIQALLKSGKIPAVDLQAACTGFIYALSLAKAYIESGMYKRILIVASEKMSAFVDYSDRNTCILFGDGAAAAVVADEGEGFAISAVCLGADGDLALLGTIPAGGVRHPASKQTIESGMHYFRMDGKEVFKHAVRRMGAAAKECLQSMGLTDKDVSWLVPHQANLRIMEAVTKKFNVPMERLYKTVHKYGNTSASSVAIALEELISTESINAGEHILLAAFGIGLTWGAAVLTKERF